MLAVPQFLVRGQTQSETISHRHGCAAKRIIYGVRRATQYPTSRHGCSTAGSIYLLRAGSGTEQLQKKEISERCTRLDGERSIIVRGAYLRGCCFCITRSGTKA